MLVAALVVVLKLVFRLEIHEFIGFPVSSTASSSDSIVVEKIVTTLVRLDAVVAISSTFFRASSSEKVGGNRQKLYIETFSTFLPVAFALLVEQIRLYVEHWCLQKLTLSSLTIHAPRNLAQFSFQRKPMVEVCTSFVSRRVIADVRKL